MVTIRCPNCGSPVMVRGNRWECGYCGDFGALSSLHPSEKEKLKAAELLGKRYALFTDKVETDVDMDLNITIDYGEDNTG